VTFAYANASVRRGVLTGTVLQAVGISLPVALPIDLPLNFHPAAIRVTAEVTPVGAL